MRRVCQDFVRVCEDTEFEQQLHFSAGSSLIASTDYRITGEAARDRMFVSRVLEVGPGKPVGPGGALWLDELKAHLSPQAYYQARAQFSKASTMPALEVGNLVVSNLNSVSYRIPATDGHYLLRGNTIMATIERETYRVGPVQHYLLVRHNEARALRAISRGPIWVPTQDMTTDDRPARKASGIVATYGEVVDQGNGAWIDGQWLESPAKPGDLILYDASFATLPITIRGERMDLVASTQVVDIVEAAAG